MTFDNFFFGFGIGRGLEAIGGSSPESDGGGGSEPESDGGKLSIAGLKLDASYQLNALDAHITFFQFVTFHMPLEVRRLPGPKQTQCEHAKSKCKTCHGVACH